MIAEPALRSLNVIQAGNRTRVVFNLNKPQTFETRRSKGNAVLVTLTDQAPAIARGAGVSALRKPRSRTAPHALRDVDFRRGTSGEGRIVVDLSDNSAGIDIRQQGKTPDRRFPQDVAAAQPRTRGSTSTISARRCVTIDTFPQGQQHADGHRAAGPVGAFGLPDRQPVHPRDQAGPARIPNKLTQGTRAGYKGEKLSLNFQNVEVRAVLQVIADFTGPQHHHQRHGAGQPDAAPEGHSVGPGARHHPADQGPRHAQERQRRADRAARGAGAEGEAAARERAADQRARAADLRIVPAELHQGVGPRSGSSRPTGSSSSAQAPGRRATTGGQGSILSQRGVAMVDPRSNILFVQDTACSLEEVRKIIRQIDFPIRQVLIEARIVIASDKFSQQLGVRFGQQTGFTFSNKKYAGGLERQPVPRSRSSRAPGRLHRAKRATQTPFELASGIARAGYSGFAAAQRQPAGAQPGRAACADVDQPRQRQPHQPRALGARGGRARQGDLESARRHGRQPEGGDRAGHGNPVRDAGQRQLSRRRSRSRRRCCGSK